MRSSVVSVTPPTAEVLVELIQMMSRQSAGNWIVCGSTLQLMFPVARSTALIEVDATIELLFVREAILTTDEVIPVPEIVCSSSPAWNE